MNPAVLVLDDVLRRAAVSAEQVEDVILGCVTPIGDQGANIGRLAALKAGFPVAVPGLQLNRMCGSGQQAVHFAAQAILAGDMDLVIAGGVEMMSRAPLGSDWPQEWPSDFPYQLVHQGMSAELMAEKWNLDRESLDDFAWKSHLRAGEAIREGQLKSQILPIPIYQNGKTVSVDQDQGVRMKPDRETMAALPPVFRADGVITAGNSSQISDGAAAFLLASERGVQQQGLEPMARIVARSVIGSDPVLMLDAPIPATRQVLQRAGLSITDFDQIEINEAFASVVLAWHQETGADLEVTNPDGGMSRLMTS